MSGIWAAVPVKEFANAKQRLAPLLTPSQRRALAAAMLEDVLAALSAAPLAGIMVTTLDPAAAAIARRYGARVIVDGAREGHTGAVTAMGRILTTEGKSGMLALPGDIPRITAAEIAALRAAHRPAPAFTIAPAHDERGSNAILMSPPDAVPLHFGDNSFFPHLDAARRQGIEPVILNLAGIALDIDNPEDVPALLAVTPRMRTRAVRVLAQCGIA
jgi:2-phospho-L-lactate/phosphoenolpyruvate guanylyltransferase